MDEDKIEGLLLIDCEPSKGVPFFLRKEIKEHLGKGKVGETTLLSNVDAESLKRIQEAVIYMTESQKRTFMSYTIVSSGAGYLIKSNAITITNGDFSIKKLKFKRDSKGKICAVNALNTKKMDKSNIQTILKEIYKEYSSEKNIHLAGTNVAYDVSHLKYMLSIAYAISAENISKIDFDKYMKMIDTMKTKDMRHSFIDLILKKDISVDNMNVDTHREKYISYCILNSFITRSLNLVTTQEVMHNFSQSEKGIGFVKQTHTSDQDLNELATLIVNKIDMMYKSGIDVTFSEDSGKVETSSYNTISLKDIKQRLTLEGFLIYTGNLKQWENITDIDIDSITYIPKKAYYNDPPELKRLIEVEMGTVNTDRLKYFKEMFKKIIQSKKAKTMSEKYQLGIVTGITKITLDTLVDVDIKAIAKVIDPRRIGRVKFILYYFLEQQKIITMIKALNDIYGDRRSLSLPNSVTSYSKLIEMLSNGKIMGIFRDKLKDSGAKIELKDVLTKYLLAITRAIETEALEYKCSLSLIYKESPIAGEPVRKGGVYYEQKRTDIADSTIVGYDSILWSNGNGLSIYFGFFPGKSFLYVSFKRKKGTGYKSYIYNGIDYKYYTMILTSILMNRSIGKSVWKYLRNIRVAIQHKSLIRGEKGKVDKRTKYFEDVSGESGVYRKDEQAEGIDYGYKADEQASRMSEHDAEIVGGLLYVRAFFQEASTIRKR